MSISYRQLQAFVQVAQSNTFAEAAEKMHLSQPALSIAIKKMELGLGGPLFSRTTRKVQLSPEGQEFLPSAVRLLNDWNNAVSDMHNLFAMQRGKLHIAAMPSFANSILPKLVGDFLQRWSNININVVDVVMEDVIQHVLEGRAEVGFTFEHEQMEGLEFRPLHNDEFIVVCHSSSELAHVKSVSWQDLCDQPFVAMNRGSSIRRWIDGLCEQQGLALNIVAEAGQLATLGQFVQHNIGVSVVPGLCKGQIGDDALTFLPIRGNNLVKRIGVIRTQRPNLSVPAQAFWDQITS